VLTLNAQGMNEVIAIPKGWEPKSLTLTTDWPQIFPMTMEDLKNKVGVGVQVANANIISRESITRWVAKDFGIDNIDEEISKVAAQPVMNPFGAF
jgi:3-deoxy-D-manno-octulosonic-acid transferase